MSDRIIDKLTSLSLEKKYLKRKLDIYFFDNKKRRDIFERIKQIDKDIEYYKFKSNLERRMKDNDKNSNSSKPNN